MSAWNSLNRVQFHATMHPETFPATDWVHLGSRQAAHDREGHVREHEESLGARAKMGVVAAKIRGTIPLGNLTDEQANQIPYDKYDYSAKRVVPEPPGAHSYVNEYEDPGSISYIAHKSRVKVIYRGPVK